MNSIRRSIREALCRDEAATSVEYAVILGLIVMTLILAITAVGTNTGGLWTGIKSHLNSAGF